MAYMAEDDKYIYISDDPAEIWQAKAERIRESNPGLTIEQAKDRAALEDPGLLAAIDKRG